MLVLFLLRTRKSLGIGEKHNRAPGDREVTVVNSVHSLLRHALCHVPKKKRSEQGQDLMYRDVQNLRFISQHVTHVLSEVPLHFSHTHKVWTQCFKAYQCCKYYLATHLCTKLHNKPVTFRNITQINTLVPLTDLSLQCKFSTRVPFHSSSIGVGVKEQDILFNLLC